MSTIDAISLTAAPANASEIALEEDADLEERRQAQDLACPSIITFPVKSCSILIVVPNEDHTVPWPVQQNNPPRHSADARVAQGPPCQFR